MPRRHTNHPRPRRAARANAFISLPRKSKALGQPIAARPRRNPMDPAVVNNLRIGENAFAGLLTVESILITAHPPALAVEPFLELQDARQYYSAASPIR